MQNINPYGHYLTYAYDKYLSELEGEDINKLDGIATTHAFLRQVKNAIDHGWRTGFVQIHVNKNNYKNQSFIIKIDFVSRQNPNYDIVSFDLEKEIYGDNWQVTLGQAEYIATGVARKYVSASPLFLEDTKQPRFTSFCIEITKCLNPVTDAFMYVVDMDEVLHFRHSAVYLLSLMEPLIQNAMKDYVNYFKNGTLEKLFPKQQGIRGI